MMMSIGGGSLYLPLSAANTHAYLLQRRMQILALLHLCCAIDRGRGDAHGVLWCGRRVLGFFLASSACRRGGRSGSRAFEQLQPWKRWPVAWIGCVGGGGGGLWWLAGHTNAAGQ